MKKNLLSISSKIVSIGIFLSFLMCFGAYASLMSTQPVLYNPTSIFKASGIAFDAHESLLEKARIEGAQSFFKPDASQFTWWGEFKASQALKRSDLEAHWFSPPDASGYASEVASQKFLKKFKHLFSKVTLQTSSLSQPLAQGTWRVDIFENGQKIDSKNFVVYGGTPTSAAAPSSAPQLGIDVVPS